MPKSYADPVSGYKLAKHLAFVRHGTLWKGHPDEANRIEWLESLPGWAWKARETDEWREGCSKRAKKQFETQESRDELSTRGKVQVMRDAADGKPSLAERLSVWWANADDATRPRRLPPEAVGSAKSSRGQGGRFQTCQGPSGARGRMARDAMR